MPVPRADYLSPVWAEGIFTDKVLFCTGGAGTICSAQTRAFVALGGNAMIVGRNVSKTEAMAKDLESARPGSTVIGLGNIDVRSAPDLQKAADRCAQELGGIDFAIAGAAGNFLAPMSQLSANAFKSVMDIDVLGSYNTAKATLPHLLKSAAKNPNTSSAAGAAGTGGRIIFISATFHYRGQPLQAHVSAAKSAVDQISASVALEYGPLGITSNVISPGPIENTEGMERLSKSDPDSVAKGKKGIPLGRWGSVREIADAMVYLWSGAGSYVNGHVLVVDGGAWRTQGVGMGGTEYPDFLIEGSVVEGVKGGKKSKL